MFAKLLKHEFKSTAPLLGLLSLAVLVVGCAGGGMLRYMITSPMEAEAQESLSILIPILFSFVFISLIAYGVGGEIYLGIQFYKSKFTDRGYLTFTLPVPAWQIFVSSLLNVLLWTMLIGLVLIIAFACIFLIGVYNTEIWHSMLDANLTLDLELREAFGDFGKWSILYGIVEFISGVVLMLTSITLGSVLAKKHKVLGILGCYYGISMLMSALSSWLTSRFMFSGEETQIGIVFLMMAAVSALTALGGALLSIWLMDRKLNLP